MSGPKCSSYSVSNLERQRQEEERRRRELVEVQKKISSLEKQVSNLDTKIQMRKAEYQDEGFHINLAIVKAVVNQSDVQELKGYMLRLMSSLNQNQTLLETELKRCKMARVEVTKRLQDAFKKKSLELAAEVAQGLHERPNASDILRDFAKFEKQQKLESEQKRIAALGTSIERKLKRINPDISNDQRTELEQLAAEILISSEKRAKDLLHELSYQVQSYNNEAEKIAKQKQSRLIRDEETALKARDWLAKFEDFPDVLPRILRTKLEEVQERKKEFSPEVVQDLEKIHAQALKNADQEYASKQIEEALIELGYDVTSDFQTLSSESNQYYFQKPKWQNYYVKLDMKQHKNELNFNVVKLDTSNQSQDNAIRDKEIESEWCSEFGEVLDALKEKGISTQVSRQLPAGALPVATVQGQTSAKIQARRGRQKQKSQKRAES